jgi:dienelactone hydrolase
MNGSEPTLWEPERRGRGATRGLDTSAVLRAVLTLCVAALVLVCGAGPASAGKWARSAAGVLELPPDAPVPTAAGTVHIRITRTLSFLDIRLSGLEPFEKYAVRLDMVRKPSFGKFRASRNGSVRLRVRSDRLPLHVPSLLANRPLEVNSITPLGIGPKVLTGRIPIVDRYPYWVDPDATDPDPVEPDTTRLAGVDGDGPLAVTSATFALPTAVGGLQPGSTVVWFPGGGTTVSAGGPWPPVVLVHAFEFGAGDYAGWARTIASWGFVVAVPDHADPLVGVDNEKQVRTTLGVMDWLVAQNADPKSPFRGQLDLQKFGFVGHSLGGGAAIVAGTRAITLGRVKAAVGIAPAALTTQAGLFGSPTPLRPDTTSGYWPATLVVTGTQDGLVAPAVSQASYFAPSTRPHAFVRIDGHCHVNYADSVPAVLQPLSDFDPATCTTQAAQLAEARTYVIPWLLYHLRGDQRVRDYVDGKYAAEQANVAERTFE